MCGIITAVSKKETVNQKVLDQYEDQYSRGTEGFGAVFVNSDLTFSVKRSTEPVKALVDLNLIESKFIMFHHRYPTSSANKINQTHPLLVSNKKFKYDYLLIHNGVIRNDEELMEQHEGIGFKYNTKYEEYTRNKFNDSESLAIEVASYLEGKIKSIDIDGSASFVTLVINKKEQTVHKLVYGTNGGSPLKAIISKDEIFISSIGEGEDVPKNTLFTVNPKTLEITKKPLKFKEPKIEPIFNNSITYNKTSLPVTSSYENYYSKNDKESETVKIDGKSYSKDYADIIKEGKKEIEDSLETFFEYIQNITYTNNEETLDAIKEINNTLYKMEARAQVREEELAIQEYEEEAREENKTLLAQEEKEMEDWNKSFKVE